MIFVDQPINTGFSYSNVSIIASMTGSREPQTHGIELRLLGYLLFVSDVMLACLLPGVCHHTMTHDGWLARIMEDCRSLDRGSCASLHRALLVWLVHACFHVYLTSLQDPRDRVSDEHLVGEDMLDFLWEFYKGEQLYGIHVVWIAVCTEPARM